MANPHSTAVVAAHPLHLMLVPVPVACFVGTLLSDLLFAATAQPQWASLSSWLLTIGLVVALVALVAGLIVVLWEPHLQTRPNAWIHGIGNAVAVVLSLWNVLVHSDDGYSAIVPTGLVLSASVVVILAITGWNGWSLAYRPAIGVK